MVGDGSWKVGKREAHVGGSDVQMMMCEWGIRSGILDSGTESKARLSQELEKTLSSSLVT